MNDLIPNRDFSFSEYLRLCADPNPAFQGEDSPEAEIRKKCSDYTHGDLLALLGFSGPAAEAMSKEDLLERARMAGLLPIWEGSPSHWELATRAGLRADSAGGEPGQAFEEALAMDYREVVSQEPAFNEDGLRDLVEVYADLLAVDPASWLTPPPTPAHLRELAQAHDIPVTLSTREERALAVKLAKRSPDLQAAWDETVAAMLGAEAPVIWLWSSESRWLQRNRRTSLPYGHPAPAAVNDPGEIHLSPRTGRALLVGTEFERAQALHVLAAQLARQIAYRHQPLTEQVPDWAGALGAGLYELAAISLSARLGASMKIQPTLRPAGGWGMQTEVVRRALAQGATGDGASIYNRAAALLLDSPNEQLDQLVESSGVDHTLLRAMLVTSRETMTFWQGTEPFRRSLDAAGLHGRTPGQLAHVAL